MRNACDFPTTEQALAVTIHLFKKLCYSKLAPNGVLLLFQPGGKADRIEILQAASENGWECSYSLTWDKGHLAVGNHTSPYRVCTEKIYVFVRKGDRVTKHQNGNYSSDILSFPTQTTSATVLMDFSKIEYGDYHIFQKPESLMDFLVKTHSYPGDLVVEPFGCSGSGIISAIKQGRKWVYIESNKQNYIWGKKRIVRTLSNHIAEAG
jgi:hypothetical protein